jgi:hypothetical protein
VALPWVALEYPDLNWDWLVDRVKVTDCQNRLGFVVAPARQVAVRRRDTNVASRLTQSKAPASRSTHPAV